ncbi:MAG: L-ribulose-5-phosphate 3-epimerase [Treponema sp.]|nr:L-ribulose-5-phosphate 3-epimerase [Treponema sp.]
MTTAYELGMYEKAVPPSMTWFEKLSTAKNAGYDFVEISIDETDEKLARLDMPLSERIEFIKTMEAAGIFVRSMCLSGHRKYPLGSSDATTEKRSLEIMQKAIQFAADVGIRIIMLAGYDVYYEESTAQTAARFERNLRTSVEMAASAGVLLAFETMETPFMDTVAKARHYVDAVRSPYLHIYPDLGNITNAAHLYGTDAADDLESGRGALVGIHIKETVPGKYREIPFGIGHVDFKTLLAKSWSLGVRRYVTELWYTNNDDWQERLTEAVQLARGILDRISAP